MTPLTERTEIEALAIELGWAIQQDGSQTRFGFDGQTLTADWSDGSATRAVITAADGGATAWREFYPWQQLGVGAWVRMMLHAIVVSRPAEVAG